MGFYFANPWGLLALGGIAVVVLLHFLRRKSRQVTVSTLFLVQRLMPSSEGGKHVRKFRNTLPFWVQLLTVVALALLLAQPRWIDARSSQTVVAIFDGSASMSAFRKEALAAAAVELKRREPNAATTQWIVLRSDGIRLAAGSRLSDVLAQTERAWQPTLGVHDLAEAKRLARALAGPNGSVVYFTDHPPTEEEAAGASWIAVGEPIENAGFLAAGINNGRWTALLRNFGRSTREVRWRISGEADWRIQRLEPGQAVELSGELPTGADRLTLELEGDRFGFDDRVPLIKPHLKPLAIRAADNEEFRALFDRILRVAEPVENAAGGTPDISLEVSNPLSPSAVSRPAIIFAEDSGKPGKLLSGPIVSENHSLMKDLNWQGLVARDTFGVAYRDHDSPLLWQGGRPLIFLRATDNAPQLVFNFDVRHSNAARLPAFGLLLHRFLSARRAEKVAYEAANVETRQRIAVAGVGPVVAPEMPEFFSLKGTDDHVLFDGAARFSDV
ncbi:MAG TPA: BatA domain-containing protein, partial [Terrimicrobiaceae bacterium]|nr:BatA domain-containing protein [Terrimicrobiaceae bacterium]